jgi:hypothetical protein
MHKRTVPSSRDAAFPGWAGLPPAATYVRSNENMSPEERIQQSVATALAAFRARVDEDGREQAVPSSWPEVIEILVRHASRCLEALSVQKAASTTPTPRFWVPPTKGTPQQTSEAPAGSASPQPTPEAKAQECTRNEASMPMRSDAEASQGREESARGCARLLLLDIKSNHEPAVDEGRRSRNRLSRMGPEIERARRIYDERAPASLRTRAELFHQEHVATLCGGDPALPGFRT